MQAALPGGETIEVFTYRAARHGPDDPIVVVLPGAGRNGDDYRDSWIEAAERHDLLVLSPAFDDVQFPGPISYNLGGMIAQGADPATLDDIQVTASQTWIHADIEAIFDKAVQLSGSSATHYDLFGHSAGAQIIHRMILFAPELRVRTALAANAGWYTTAEADVAFPYGIKGISLPPGQLEKAFARRLVVFLGERDNADETRGSLRATPETNAQGLHRLARGCYFYAAAVQEQTRLKLPTNWQLKIVPGVGHDYRRMANAAAEYLYPAPDPAARQMTCSQVLSSPRRHDSATVH